FIPSSGAAGSQPAVAVAPRTETRRAESAPLHSTPSKPAAGSFAQRTTRRVLKNGIILDVVENHSVPTVAIRGLVFAGDTAAPPSNPVIPAMTARMLQRGTKSRTKEQIGELLDGVGATRAYG